jgi:hypothetical protein
MGDTVSHNYTLYIPSNAGINRLQSQENTVKIYPNPVINNLNVISNSAIHRISIINMIGETVIDKDCSSMNMVINTSGLMPGIYYLIIENSSGVATRKITKQ